MAQWLQLPAIIQQAKATHLNLRYRNVSAAVLRHQQAKATHLNPGDRNTRAAVRLNHQRAKTTHLNPGSKTVRVAAVDGNIILSGDAHPGGHGLPIGQQSLLRADHIETAGVL